MKIKFPLPIWVIIIYWLLVTVFTFLMLMLGENNIEWWTYIVVPLLSAIFMFFVLVGD